MRTSFHRTVSRLAHLGVLVAALSFGACSSSDGTDPANEIEGASGSETAGTEAGAGAAEAAVVADPAAFPDVVASVNGTDIAKADLVDRVLSIEAQRGGSSPETASIAFYRQVLDEIVGAELLFQASQERNLKADEANVDSQLNAIQARFPDAQVFEQALTAQGMTLDALRAQIARDMSIQKLIETDISPTVNVSDEDKRAFYEENREQMREPDQLRLSHILKRVDPSAAPADRETARVAIESVLAEARSGSDFAALAREHSEDPGSAASGGEMMVARGQTVPPFEEAAFALEPGDVSDVVETRFGFHVIKLFEKTEGRTLPYAEVEPRLAEVVQQQKLGEAIESVVETLKSDGDVDLFI